MSSNHRTTTAAEWFAGGDRVAYDPGHKRIIDPTSAREAAGTIGVFRRIEADSAVDPAATWTTFLPGFPDGSFGWARVADLLRGWTLGPKLFVEYIGQGDSDKPRGYPYGTIERADLVEAIWRAEGIESSVVVTFDYSSIVLLELLSRREQIHRGAPDPPTRIAAAILANGGLFADAHSHPWFTTPLLKSRFGKLGTRLAERSGFAFGKLMDVLFSKDYDVSDEELSELRDAIGRRDGMAFLHEAAGFVDEHRAHAERWDFGRLSRAHPDIPMRIVGSEEDPFEPRQIDAVRRRLGRSHPSIDMLPGGHLTTSEQPGALAGLIRETVRETIGATTDRRADRRSASDPVDEVLHRLARDRVARVESV